MKQFGKLFYRPVFVLVIVMMVIVAAMPISASAMLELQSDDFNVCSIQGSMWTFENFNNIAGANAVIEGAYTGDSYLKLNVPNSSYASFSSGNVAAPRIMTPISNTSFEVEVKFLAPQISTSADGYKIQGMLFRDSTNAAAVEWVRIDVNSNAGVMKSYVTYLQTNDQGYISQTADDVKGRTALNGGLTAPAFVIMRVKYDQPSGAWKVTYTVNGEVTVLDFNNTDLVKSTGFTPTHMGLFVANSSADTSAMETKIDYIQVIGTTLNDDATKLNVTTVGNGTVTQTSCPVGVAGNVVRLQAVPATGATFIGWSGAATGTTNPLDVTMDGTKSITATFSGSSVVFDEFLYLPLVHR